ncbi:ribonuclease HI [Oscillospiraceae bacterium LTW-04]|nr:ribonuclease HI [Oscillospiraceae bacterium MB24-C1]
MSIPQKKVSIFTDGACSGNPGPGGWGAILRYGTVERELSGGERETTNNRMELTAVIQALSALKEPCDVTIYSDSKYVIDAVEKGWARGWRARGWVKADKKPALNVDLWQQLLELLERHNARFVWVKGHNEHPENERCDRLAVAESKKF